MMRKLLFFFTLILGCLLASCHKDSNFEGREPSVLNDTVEVYAERAVFRWEVDYPGKIGSVVELGTDKEFSDGVRYGEEQVIDKKQFEVEVDSLADGKSYYYRYVVWNRFDTYKTEAKRFTTTALLVPTVETDSITEVSYTSAICHGEVSADGGAEVTSRGFCYALHENPTMADSVLLCGEGMGAFEGTLTGLAEDTRYYVKAFATNRVGTVYGSQKTFTTLLTVSLPEVTTLEVTNITQTTATGGGNVTSSGNADVTERGICWSTSHNPTTSDSHKSSGSGTGSFTVDMTGLTAGTTYYVRAYAINSQGLAYGEEVSFKTSQTPTYIISVSANPTNGGTVTGSGTYQQGQSCTVTATQATGYNFLKWTENGTQVSTDTSYTFNVTGNRTLVAQFQKQSYTISVSSDPSNGGTVSGGGTYTYGQSCTVHAAASNGYTFSNWTENGSQVSTYANYTFTVTSNSSLIAHFVNTPIWPNGILPGSFSVSATQQVHFSQGNLQYRASTNTWRFAEHQWDYVGHANQNISQTYSGWIDLFGWGTSGYNHGAVCYQPWSTSLTNSDYYAYGQSTNNLYDQTGQADWGYNPISNGGDTEHTWRTLTHEEWVYVFHTRNTSSGIRYAKATVNNVNGVILLPDDWNSSYYSFSSVNTAGATFTSNIISSSQWSTLEQHGAVFLPAAGLRNGTSVSRVGSYGYYWSASCYDSNFVWGVYFNDSSLNTGSYTRDNGHSVRLVLSPQ